MSPFLLKLAASVGALVVSFIIGCVIGAFIWWKFKKPWPADLNRLAEEIGFLEDELPKTNSAVELIRTKAGYTDDFGRASLSVSKSDNPEDVLTRRLRVAKTRFICYRRDLEGVASFLGPAGPTSMQGPAHDMREPKQPTPREELTSQLVIEGTNEEALSEYAPIEVDIRIESKGERFDGAATPQELVGLYNRAVTDSVSSARFRERYQPIRIGTTNAVERRVNPALREEFKETTDGDFFAVPLLSRDRYAVVPRLGLTIETVSLNAGALGKVFSNPTYDAKAFYSQYSVRKPAIFRHEGDCWELDAPGYLDLGDPD